MHKLKSLALLALAGLGLSASGGVTTNAWWDVTFESDTFQEGFPGLVSGELGPLTNDASKAQVIQPYATGVWTALDGDESYVTNSLATNWVNGAMTEVLNTTYIKLDTQGNDLKWAVADNNAMADGLKALVDADLYLVGSDSPPDASDFDPSDAPDRVQTAVYLKNEIEEDSGETTNSVLCVYVFNSTLNGGIGANEWQELDGVELEDNAWAHVQVLVDHSDDLNNPPTVQVFVNGTQMHARNGDATSWTAANGSASQTAGRVSSVSFRGTGAVDNFVGQTILDDPDKYDFTAEVYMDGVLQAVGTEGNVSRIVVSNEVGKTAPFRGFAFHDYVSGGKESTFSLTKIELVNQGNGAITTLNYTYQNHQIVPETVSQYVDFKTDSYYEYDDDGEEIEIEYQTGEFDVEAPTEGATSNGVVAKIYFEELPAEGDFKLKVTQNVGTAPAEQKFNTNKLSVASTTFTFAEALTDGGTSYVLSKIVLGAAPAGISLDYTSPNAVVTVPLSDQIAEGTYNVATATYAEGTLGADETLSAALVNGEWVFTKKTKPVAIIVAGNVTNEYDSLRGAITNATPGDTIYLVADDHVSFTAEALEIEIDKALTIDGGSNTLFGVSGYSAGGYHDIFVVGSGALTIKDLKFSEFGDTATSFQYETYPIVTSGDYTGQLTLDGVTIDKFARTAVNLNGGTVLITNCTFTADPTAYFQTGVETLNAVVTVVDTTITGVNSTITGEDPEGAAVFTLKGHDGYTGTGSITVLSGEYSGQFIVAAEALATGSVILSNGTFIATADAAESAFNLDAGNVEISGGWFDREPEAKYIAQGLAAYKDAPGEDAPWTVRAAKVTIDFYVDGAVYATTSVVVGATGYAPADPEKAADAQYAYAFTGWTNVVGESYSAATLPAATTATNYYAVFTATARQYDVEWIVDGVYTTNTWAYGDTPSWNENDPTAVPTKDSTEATNFTFKAWSPAVASVTGFASYTATWTETARTYAITFKTNGVVYTTVDAEWDATGYAPADPTAPEGKVFKGWATEADPTTVLATLPNVAGEATYEAVFEDASQLQPVDPGQSMSAAEKAANPPVAIDGTDFVVHFKGQSGVTYQLVAMPTCTGTTEQWLAATPVGTAVTCSDETAVLELKAPMGTDTVKFFKIKASK